MLVGVVGEINVRKRIYMEVEMLEIDFFKIVFVCTFFEKFLGIFKGVYILDERLLVWVWDRLCFFEFGFFIISF